MQTNTQNKGPGMGLAAIILALPVVAFFEGFYPKTYIDPVGIPTVCFGETDRSITMQERFSKDECYVLLGASLQKHAAGLSKCIYVPLKDHESAAVLSWGYNVGVDAACQSTLVAKINAGAPAKDWCPELKRWVFADGKKLKGLELRRDAEYAICMNIPESK